MHLDIEEDKAPLPKTSRHPHHPNRQNYQRQKPHRLNLNLAIHLASRYGNLHRQPRWGDHLWLLISSLHREGLPLPYPRGRTGQQTEIRDKEWNSWAIQQVKNEPLHPLLQEASLLNSKAETSNGDWRSTKLKKEDPSTSRFLVPPTSQWNRETLQKSAGLQA